MFDLTRRATFEAVRKWKEDLDEKVVTSDGAKVTSGYKSGLELDSILSQSRIKFLN